MEKFQLQWKSIKKAFSDLNKGKSGAINPLELKAYLNNWGLTITEEQFQDIFDMIDYDHDGKITYEDLQNSVGKYISPEEFLYFR
jgi:Ca2+-binding EF-hand superfamily protein